MIYIPLGKTITVNTSSIKSENLNAWWFNPRTSDNISLGLIKNIGKIDFTTPTVGFEYDWVLIIDNPKFNYSKPKKQ